MEWISVKDRLPEFYIDEEFDDAWHENYKQTYFSEAVLVYGQNDFGCFGVFYADYEKEYDFAKKKWSEPYFRSIGYPIHNVTHWMPLPEKPKHRLN